MLYFMDQSRFTSERHVCERKRKKSKIKRREEKENTTTHTTGAGVIIKLRTPGIIVTLARCKARQLGKPRPLRGVGNP